jgi:predicted dithiol-disulfide oxidoreductase (DUF899 family)
VTRERAAEDGPDLPRSTRQHDLHGAEGSGEFAARAESPPGESPGTSFFLRVDDRVFHTYSTFARGAEQTGGSARESRPDFAS